jgi:hypothetical protein
MVGTLELGPRWRAELLQHFRNRGSLTLLVRICWNIDELTTLALPGHLCGCERQILAARPLWTIRYVIG